MALRPAAKTRRVLTDRQREVLRHRALGRSVTETAGDLGIAEQTVKNHLQRIYHVLHVTNLSEAYRAVGWLRVA